MKKIILLFLLFISFCAIAQVGNNTRYGYQALYLSKGLNNTAFGYKALSTMALSSRNTAFGSLALSFPTTSSTYGYNTAIGYNALSGCTNDQNTAVGANSLASNTGVACTAVGSESMYQNTGTASTGIGNNALYLNKGTGNVALGGYAGYVCTGSYNTFLGYSSGSVGGTRVDSTRYSIMLGYNSITTKDHVFKIGTDGALDVDSGAVQILSGTDNDTLGANKGTKAKLIIIGKGYFSDTIYAAAHITYSDLQLKENVTSMNDILPKIRLLTGRYYNGLNEVSSIKHSGFIAQEVEKVFPNVVTEVNHFADGRTMKIKAVDYIALLPYFLEAIKELDNKVKNMEDFLRKFGYE